MPAQRTVMAGVIAVVLIALGMTALVTLGKNDESSSAADGAPPSSTASPGTSATPGDEGSSGSDAAPGPSSGTSSADPSEGSSDGSSDTPGASSSATPGGSGDEGTGGSGDDQPLEVPVPTQATEQALPGLSDGPDPDAPLLTQLPPAGNAKGSLVKGYPKSVLPPVKGSKIINSAISVDGKRATITLTARSSRSVDAILRFYRIRFGARAFEEEPAAPAAGSSAAAFVRDRNTVAVTVTPQGKKRTYTLYAVLVVGS